MGLKSQHNCEGPRRRWNPGRRLPEGKQNKGEKEGKTTQEEDKLQISEFTSWGKKGATGIKEEALPGEGVRDDRREDFLSSLPSMT